MAGLFSGQAAHPDTAEAYRLYLRRRRGGADALTYAQFSRAVKAYCRLLAGRLEATGMAELPCGLGGMAVVRMRRRPRWDRKLRKWRSADAVDWAAAREAGTAVRRDSREALGVVYLPSGGRRVGDVNRMCLGLRANRALYRRIKAGHDAGTLGFTPHYMEEMK